MMPPTSIDGTDITGATIDGTDVTEITVDGQTVFSALLDVPDSGDLQVHIDASQESLSNGNTTTTISDFSGNGYDLTGDAVTFEGNYVGNFPTFDFNGSSRLDNTTVSLTQPFTMAFVAESVSNNDSQFLFAGGTIQKHINIDTGEFNNRISVSSESQLSATGEDDLDRNILLVVFNGSSSVIRKNGTQIASGNVGNADWTELMIGDRGDSFYFVGKIPEVLVYTGDKSSRAGDIEQYLNNRYNTF